MQLRQPQPSGSPLKFNNFMPNLVKISLFNPFRCEESLENQLKGVRKQEILRKA